MTDLTKTRTVLQAQGWVKDRMMYAPDYDEGEDAFRTTQFALDKDVYEDMGKPTDITVTIEPGDLLNRQC